MRPYCGCIKISSAYHIASQCRVTRSPLCNLPCLCLCGTISLSSILEPVANLSCRQSCCFSKLSLLARRRVRIVRVPFSKDIPRAFLETVARLLTIPDRARQGKFPPHAIFADSTQRPSSQFLCLTVVCFQPQRLQFSVRGNRKIVVLQNTVQLLKIALMEVDHRFGF